jgi:hypothetical protein
VRGVGDELEDILSSRRDVAAGADDTLRFAVICHPAIQACGRAGSVPVRTALPKSSATRSY